MHLVIFETVHLFEPCERSSLEFLFSPVRLGRDSVTSTQLLHDSVRCVRCLDSLVVLKATNSVGQTLCISRSRMRSCRRFLNGDTSSTCCQHHLVCDVEKSLAHSTHSPVLATAPTRQFWLGFFAFPDNATHCDMPRGDLRILFDRAALCLRIGLLHGPRSTQLCEPVLSRNSHLQQARPTFVERRAHASTVTGCWRMTLPAFARNGPPTLSLEK